MSVEQTAANHDDRRGAPMSDHEENPACGVCGGRLAPGHLRAFLGAHGADYGVCPGGQPVKPLLIFPPTGGAS